MKAFSRRRAQPADIPVEISERDGVRSLHLGSRTVQSAMRIADPWRLELPYSRAMMAFLLFQPTPRRVLSIGLGGGSLVKFIYRQLPHTRQTALEISPQVIVAARAQFCVPADDDRLEVIAGDGAAYVAAHPESTDVLLVDGFDGTAHAPELVTPQFWGDCRDALGEDGIFAVNLWLSAADFADHLGRVESAFDGLTIALPAEKHGNVVVFGLRRSPGPPLWEDLLTRAAVLTQRHGLEFADFVRGLRAMNPHTERRLLI